MNKLDSSLVSSALSAAGFDLTDHVKEADVVLINTCSVRDHAEQRVLSHLGHLKGVKRNKPDLVVGVIGCMAQRLGDELLENGVVDIVAGPAQIPQIPEMVMRAVENRTKAVAVTAQIRGKIGVSESQALDAMEFAYDSDDNYIPGQAFVRVMRGCDKFCSYCVVPYVRGPEVSRSPVGIVEQVKRLGDKGVKQITLLGQTVNSYKYTEGGRTYGLADLLGMVSDVAAVSWVRFITSHPRDFDESILHAMADIDKVCGYLHVPAQSGSDRILKAMNRNYSVGEYVEFVDKAREIVGEVSIAGDFIVGFPDESDSDFAATVELAKRVRYKNCFIFKYSARPGTRTDKKLADNVPEEVKRQRNTELLAVQEAISEENNKRFIGRKIEVLVEGLSKKPHLNRAENQDNPQLIGRTAGDHIVVFNGPEELAGQFAMVTVEKTAALTLFAAL